MKSITWKIGGEAGMGIMTTGLSFSKIAIAHGYHIFDYIEYPSLIRGGHNVYEVRVSEEEVYSQEYGIDVLVALNRDTVNLHKNNMKSGGIIVYDGDKFAFEQSEIGKADVVFYNLPLARITKEAGASKIMENNVALGASLAILSMDITPLFDLIEESFGKKGKEIVDENKKAASAGFDFVRSNPPKNFVAKLPKKNGLGNMAITANEAIGMGALAAGCKLYVAYPMTPASSILHFLARHGKDYGMVVKHAEDEISVINMGIGGGYAGVRTMIATSGGGFSLMTEGLGLCAITETPLVIVEVQRPGPASGMPTWTGQGDLQFLIHASQDESPRIILAPGDAQEAFYLTAQAFNLAEKYQTPVFILSDKYISEGHKSTPLFDLSKISIDRGKLLSWEQGDKEQEYLRYKITDDGTSPRALPGMKSAIFNANSYEHDEYGWTTEEIDERVKQVNCRGRKITSYKQLIPVQKIYGDENAELTLVAWGSTKGPVLQALQELKDENFGKSVNFLHITHVWPFPHKQAGEILQSAKNTLLIEGNSTAQLGSLIKEQTGIAIKNTYLRYDGRPFYPEDIKKKIKEILE